MRPDKRSGPHGGTDRFQTQPPPSVFVAPTVTRAADQLDRRPRPAAWLVEVAYPVGRRRFVFLKSDRASRMVRNAVERGYPATKTRVLLVPTARGGAS